MNLKILLPFAVFCDLAGVSRIVAETSQGSFGLLPRRLDCTAAIVPGILTYETRAEGEVFLAVDDGVLVKTCADVVVSVRRAIRGDDLGQLHEMVERQFLAADDNERTMRTIAAKLETGFLRRLASFQHD